MCSVKNCAVFGMFYCNSDERWLTQTSRRRRCRYRDRQLSTFSLSFERSLQRNHLLNTSSNRCVRPRNLNRPRTRLLYLSRPNSAPDRTKLLPLPHHSQLLRCRLNHLLSLEKYKNRSSNNRLLKEDISRLHLRLRYPQSHRIPGENRSNIRMS